MLSATLLASVLVVGGLVGPVQPHAVNPAVTLRPPLAWVGLFGPELVTWLENAKRLSELCGRADGTPKWRQCREEKLAPRTISIALRDAPSERASFVGSLVVVALPGIGLRAFYAGPSGGGVRGFTPDLFDRDWSHGPYFHQTYLDRHGDWFLLPEGPLKAPAWFDARALGTEPHVRRIGPGDVLRMPKGDVIVLEIGSRDIRVRPERPGDSPCGAEAAPPAGPGPERRVPLRELYSFEGHLTAEIKYTRGC